MYPLNRNIGKVTCFYLPLIPASLCQRKLTGSLRFRGTPLFCTQKRGERNRSPLLI
ncbi:hypothetical protein HMPREF0262_02204 [Clostridium sp. ATCC 29733]|nr:hypothetical protein HMPREF0262_02204 [Clostridium sp. ATCC 29733]